MITDIDHIKLALESIDSDEFYFVIYGVGACVVIAVGLWLLSCFHRSKKRLFFLIPSVIIAAIAVATAIVYCAVSLEYVYDDISPRVTITRTNGEIVSRGAMPFG